MANGKSIATLFILACVAAFVVSVAQIVRVDEATSLKPSHAAPQGLPTTTTAPHAPSQCTVNISGEPVNIYILAFNRPASLQRMLTSLLNADYLGDTVALRFCVDTHPSHNEKHEEVVRVARAFDWPFGPKTVDVSRVPAGLTGQWLRCWAPARSDERGLILEDDMTLSPLFYRWLKAAHNAYGSIADMAGVSLQRQELKARPSGKGSLAEIPIDVPYLYQLLGTWGFSPVAGHWQAFVKWQTEASFSLYPYVDGLVTTDWWRAFEATGRAHTMWEQWFIRYCSDQKLYTLYPNTQDRLISHWQEEGAHYSKAQAEAFRKNPETLASSWTATFPRTIDVYDFGYEHVGSASVQCQ